MERLRIQSNSVSATVIDNITIIRMPSRVNGLELLLSIPNLDLAAVVDALEQVMLEVKNRNIKPKYLYEI